MKRLQTHAKLISKKPLRSSDSLKAKEKLKKQPKVHTLAWYKKEARRWFNKAIKYRDCSYIEDEWLGKCITCERRIIFRDREGRFYRNAQAGHFMPETRNNTRFNDMNVNLQCSYCNGPNFGEQLRYSRELDLKYGLGTAKELEKLSKVDHQFTQGELIQIINDAKEEVRWFEKTPELSPPYDD